MSECEVGGMEECGGWFWGCCCCWPVGAPNRRGAPGVGFGANVEAGLGADKLRLGVPVVEVGPKPPGGRRPKFVPGLGPGRTRGVGMVERGLEKEDKDK